MQLTFQHRKNITGFYCIIFYLLMLHKWYNGLLFSSIKPFLFKPGYDLLTWLIMKTGLHQVFINNQTACVLFDVIFYSLPAILYFILQKSVKASSFVAALMLVTNFVYALCFTLFPTHGFEGYIAWLLFPVLFMAINLKSFYYLLNGLRYFSLFYFASAGCWKVIEYGVFNFNQMSGVLLFQHKEYLVSSPNFWYTHFIYWLINHPAISYILFVAATAVELSFVIGFLTKKFDRIFIAAFILFLLFDVLIMRIHYWEAMPLLIPLFYSGYQLPTTNNASIIQNSI